MKRFLSLFSYVFHPLFVPLLGTVFYVWLGDQYFSLLQYLLIFLQIIIVTILLPVTFFLLLKAFRKVDSLMLQNVSQRKIPLVLQMLLLSILIEKSITFIYFPELYLFFLGGIISAGIAFVLLFIKIKASLHMLGMGALTVFLIGLSINYEVNTITTVSLFFVLNGLVASSRLVMNAHSNQELVIGFLCGSIPQMALLFLWL